LLIFVLLRCLLFFFADFSFNFAVFLSAHQGQQKPCNIDNKIRPPAPPEHEKPSFFVAIGPDHRLGLTSYTIRPYKCARKPAWRLGSDVNKSSGTLTSTMQALEAKQKSAQKTLTPAGRRRRAAHIEPAQLKMTNAAHSKRLIAGRLRGTVYL
jgi:hypothetical protein